MFAQYISSGEIASKVKGLLDETLCLRKDKQVKLKEGRKGKASACGVSPSRVGGSGVDPSGVDQGEVGASGVGPSGIDARGVNPTWVDASGLILVQVHLLHLELIGMKISGSQRHLQVWLVHLMMKLGLGILNTIHQNPSLRCTLNLICSLPPKRTSWMLLNSTLFSKGFQ